jgi:hypothetical protein
LRPNTEGSDLDYFLGHLGPGTKLGARCDFGDGRNSRHQFDPQVEQIADQADGSTALPFLAASPP